ncbi:hypothetical protein Tco_1245960, partial [Tanacetum coccineum]
MQGVLYPKILAYASIERVKTYTRRRSTDSSRDSTARGLFSTAEEVQGKEQISTDKKEMASAAAKEEHERIDFEKALKVNLVKGQGMVQEEIIRRTPYLALMAFSNSEVHNNKTCSKTCLKSFETLKTQYDNLRIEFNKSEFDLATYKRGLAYVEEQLVFYKKNGVMFRDQIAVLKRDDPFKDSEINALNIQIEKLKKEKESNQIKIDNFENASKSLDKLIGSQISDNSRKGVGFESYNVVAPPPTGLFAPLTIDLSNSGLKEFQQPEFEGYGFKANKSVCENSSNEVKKTIDALIIEDWVFDCDEDDYEVMVLKSDNVQHKPEQANQLKKVSQNLRNNRTK